MTSLLSTIAVGWNAALTVAHRSGPSLGKARIDAAAVIDILLRPVEQPVPFHRDWDIMVQPQGSVISAAVPPPSRSISRRVPAWRAIRRRTTGSPRPVPSGFVV